MEKIKNIMAKMSDEIRELAKRFPLTIGIIVFVTVLFTIMIDQSFSKNLEKIYLFSAIWAIGTFFTEIYFVKKPNKVLSYGVTGGISLIFTRILTAPMTSEIGHTEITLRFLAGYAIILIVLSIYQAIKNAELTFEEYCLKVFRDLFNTTATYIILNIGIIILTSIFVQLILDGHYGSVMERLFVLLFGLFYMPALLYTVSCISTKEVGTFIKSLVLYVLLPLTTIAMAIIYLYIAKIILLQDMPQNTIYRILAGIFIVAFPVWNMAKNYAEEKKLIGKITKILPYLYAPFILLEIYSIGTRISCFGLTPMRYISCVFIVFQMICLALTFYKKNEKIEMIFPTVAVLALIVFVTPLNYENVSNWSQKRRIEKIMVGNMDFDALSDEEKDKVKSAYEYLKFDEKYIPEKLSKEDKEKIEEYTNQDREKYDYSEYVSLNCELKLNIEEYAKITYVTGSTEDKTAVVKFEDSERTLDLSQKIDEIISKNEISNIDLEEDFKENNLLKISEKEDFYISNLTFSYYKTTKKLEVWRVEGYFLER